VALEAGRARLPAHAPCMLTRDITAFAVVRPVQVREAGRRRWGGQGWRPRRWTGRLQRRSWWRVQGERRAKRRRWLQRRLARRLPRPRRRRPRRAGRRWLQGWWQGRILKQGAMLVATKSNGSLRISGSTKTQDPITVGLGLPPILAVIRLRTSPEDVHSGDYH
jgi:hypothetical protein